MSVEGRCDHIGCCADVVLVTNHGRRLCENPAHIASEDGERLIWEVDRLAPDTAPNPRQDRIPATAAHQWHREGTMSA